jgi:hypothetical protein
LACRLKPSTRSNWATVSAETRCPCLASSSASLHGEVIHNEVVGSSEGVPGQRFPLARRPIVAGDEPLTAEVAAEGGWQQWREVNTFAQSGAADRHVMLDRVSGELVFGPAVRQPDGTVTYYGAVPPKGARMCGSASRWWRRASPTRAAPAR